MRKPSRLRAGLGAAVVAMSTAGVIAGTSSPAFATADGCTFFSPLTFVFDDMTISIPGGQYCFGINGNGTQVNFTTGAYQTARMYNYAEAVRFYDNHGNNYATFWTPESIFGWAYGPHYMGNQHSRYSQSGRQGLRKSHIQRPCRRDRMRRNKLGRNSRPLVSLLREPGSFRGRTIKRLPVE